MVSFTFLLAVLLQVATSSAAPKNTKYAIKVPEKCRGKGFCSIKPEGYDEIKKEIESILPPYLINNRIGPESLPPYEIDAVEHGNCPNITTTQPVYLYSDPENPWIEDIIVQTDEYGQEITEVKCAQNGDLAMNLKEERPQCFQNLGYSNFDMKFTCEESKAKQPLLIYDNGDIILKHYDISVCCSCQIK